MTLLREYQVPRREIGARVILYDRVESTNDLAFALARDSSHHGTAIVAQTQTAGRGRLGRTWQCPPGQGILLSVLLFPPQQLSHAAPLTAWAAVAVCQMIRGVATLQPHIKWPNDVLVQGRKVAGILIERRANAVVVGIGVNVNQEQLHFTANGLAEAASLAMLSNGTFVVEDLTELLLDSLDREFRSLRHSGLAGLEQRWRDDLNLLIHHVTLTSESKCYRGKLMELSFRSVGLELSDGSHLHFLPEQVQQIIALPSI